MSDIPDNHESAPYETVRPIAKETNGDVVQIQNRFSSRHRLFSAIDSVDSVPARQMSDATVMLAAMERGDPQAAEELLVLVYDELRRIAAAKMMHEAPGQTLQPTALVHEAWLRLVAGKRPSFNDRAHFFRTAAEAMRRILIDRARRKQTVRHGGGYQRVDLDGFDPAAPNMDDQLFAVHEALGKMASEYPVQAELVKLRYFAGMTNEEAAEVLGVAVSTVKNYWAFSRAWLLNEIESG